MLHCCCRCTLQAFPDHHVFIGLNAGAKSGSGKGLRIVAERYLQVCVCGVPGVLLLLCVFVCWTLVNVSACTA